ncbi:type III restriction enzyme, res subunit [Clostridiales bacterium oral taxon 876 str. F0540]|nr:type III restriction enzyme, res subunit [Clostridiales bacterium oral taxon 876 str. F0540]
MSIILQAGLPHQEKAIQYINGVFEGVNIFRTANNFENNRIDLNSPILLRNIKMLQEKIHPTMRNDDSLGDYLNIDIKMETGTGKTYVYTKMMYELHKNYGFNKFIILVPTTPIKAGTGQFIKANYVRNHFRDQYNSEIELHILSPQKKKKGREYFPSSVSEFVKGSKLVTNKIHVLLVNSQMLTSKTVQKEYDQSFEGFSKPLESLKGTAPIVIIDEPHRFDKNNKTFKFLIDNIKPQCIVRYGATFPDTKKGKDYHNLIYNLGSCESFNQMLVKGVAVEYLSNVYEKEAKVKLTSITKNPFTAHFQLDKAQKLSSIALMKNDLLSGIDEEFSGVEIQAISNTEVVLSNGLVLRNGDAIYPSAFGVTYQELMLRLAITRHFEAERKNFLRKNKIKTLALFFIDSIHSYRGDNNDGHLKVAFEKILSSQIQNEIEEIDKLISKGYNYGEYKEYLQVSLSDLGATHAGYFSQDNATSDEEIIQEVNEILNEKEKLLSLRNEDGSFNTRRFIFSKWTLREGWDNPNVFTIAKLRSSGSEISKLQEIGRGLRLPVDENGNRISDEQFYLNYIIDHSEKDFADRLIKEINGDTPDTFKLKEDIVRQVAESLGYTYDKFKGGLMFKDYIDNGLNINEDKKQEMFAEYPQLSSGLQKDKVVNKNKKETGEVKIRPDIYKELADLWEKLNEKYFISYDDITDDELTKEVYNIFRKDVSSILTVKSVREETERYGDSVAKKDRAGAVLEIDDKLPYNVFLNKIYEQTNLPIKIVHNALVKYSKEIKISDIFFNEATIGNFVTEFFERKQELLMARFSYQKITAPIHPTALTDEKGTIKDVIAQGRLGKTTDNSSVPERYLYDMCAYDSPLEKDNIMVDGIKEVIVFGKIPNKSIRIPTVVGESYSPDFMYIIEKADGSKQLNLIIETKSADLPSDLRGKEKYKIQCAERFFELMKLSGYEVVFKRQLNSNNVKAVIDKVLG